MRPLQPFRSVHSSVFTRLLAEPTETQHATPEPASQNSSLEQERKESHPTLVNKVRELRKYPRRSLKKNCQELVVEVVQETQRIGKPALFRATLVDLSMNGLSFDSLYELNKGEALILSMLGDRAENTIISRGYVVRCKPNEAEESYCIRCEMTSRLSLNQIDQLTVPMWQHHIA